MPEAEIATCTASAKRLVAFVNNPAHPVAHVLGTHIEQAQTPYLDYPRGSRYQPEEHPLELSRAIAQATGISKWPSEIGKIDLGDRILDVIPIPGHNDASIALYDRRTGNLLTGDSLYPGRLSVSVSDLPAFTASAHRLADFARTHPVAHAFGTHIEQTTTAYLDYPRPPERRVNSPWRPAPGLSPRWWPNPSGGRA